MKAFLSLCKAVFTCMSVLNLILGPALVCGGIWGGEGWVTIWPRVWCVFMGTVEFMFGVYWIFYSPWGPRGEAEND